MLRNHYDTETKIEYFKKHIVSNHFIFTIPITWLPHGLDFAFHNFLSAMRLAIVVKDGQSCNIDGVQRLWKSVLLAINKLIDDQLMALIINRYFTWQNSSTLVESIIFLNLKYLRPCIWIGLVEEAGLVEEHNQ